MGSSPSKSEPPTLLAKAQKNEGVNGSSNNNNNKMDSKYNAVLEKELAKTDDTPETESPKSVDSKDMADGEDSRFGSSGQANGEHHHRPRSPPHWIRDEDVKVNLAMADLMAYLQVVANHSQNLPLTRRDDPEVGKPVSALSPEEYAKKSAAFVPADVRMIGGSFTKYGRVWDLPTSEEFNAVDNAQEPGKSYGGACCNSMLKVLYDAANEAADVENGAANADALFDDDDESSLLSKLSVNRTRSNDTLQLCLGDVSTAKSLSWETLLRKMKVEIEDIEYVQAPVVTSTRKLDLSKPFSLIPEDFDPTKGKKRSLLIGCNYTNSHGAELKASHDDVRSMKDYIVNVHGFPEADDLMTVLLDDDEHEQPTHQNITAAFMALSEQSQPGDALFVQFSGHGGRVLDGTNDSEAETYDEVIAPVDYTKAGLIRDTLIFKTLLAPMRYGVTVTIIIDCADTGMMMELPYTWTTKKDRPLSSAKMTNNNDFSFVRFLKVVKTLYDSSIFTQLGNTVDSALHSPAANIRDTFEQADTTEEDETCNSQTMVSHDENILRDEPPKTSLFSALTSCTSPASKSAGDKKKRRNGDHDTLTTRREHRTSLLESVLNTCGLIHEEEEDLLSDDDTYRTDGNDSHTFDSLTDDGGLESYKERARKQGLV